MSIKIDIVHNPYVHKYLALIIVRNSAHTKLKCWVNHPWVQQLNITYCLLECISRGLKASSNLNSYFGWRLIYRQSLVPYPVDALIDRITEHGVLKILIFYSICHNNLIWGVCILLRVKNPISYNNLNLDIDLIFFHANLNTEIYQ
jgi:hypothetical protein